MGINKEKMLLDIFHESRTNIILGQKGVGKTNFASVLLRDLTTYGYELYTNIHFFSDDEIALACSRGKLPKGVDYQPLPKNIHVVYKLSELLHGLIKPGRKAVFLDEAGIISPSGTSKDTKTIKQLCYVIRHFDCAFTLITQVAGSVPPDLREHLVDYRIKLFQAKSKARFFDVGFRKSAVDDNGEEYIHFPTIATIGPVPRSKLAYDGDFPSSFRLDLDLKKTLDGFGRLKSSLEVEKYGKAIIDKAHT